MRDQFNIISKLNDVYKLAEREENLAMMMRVLSLMYKIQQDKYRNLVEEIKLETLSQNNIQVLADYLAETIPQDEHQRGKQDDDLDNELDVSELDDFDADEQEDDDYGYKNEEQDIEEDESEDINECVSMEVNAESVEDMKNTISKNESENQSLRIVKWEKENGSDVVGSGSKASVHLEKPMLYEYDH